MGAATKRGVGGDGAAAMNAGLIALRQQQSSSSTTQNNNPQHSSIVSSISSNNKKKNATITINDTTTNNNNCGTVGNGELQLLFATSRNTSLVHCIDVTVRCTPMNPHYVTEQQQQQQQLQESSASSTGNTNQMMQDVSEGFGTNNAFASSSTSNNQMNNNPNTINTTIGSSSNQRNNAVEDLDGWRGHYNPFISCNGFVETKSSSPPATSSLSPKLPPGKSTSSSNISSSSTGGGPSSRRKTSAEQRILDEHLGGGGGGGGGENNDATGGLFGASPFANDYPVEQKQQQQQQAQQSDQMHKAPIVGLATCSYSSATKSTKSSAAAASTLYVASITDTPNTVGIVIHANPHLMLSSRPPSNSTLSNTFDAGKAPYASYYKPSLPFNFKVHGKPRCVTVLPGVVCVGTDSGVVLMYVFKCKDPVVDADNTSGGGSSSSGDRLTLVAEIPAPRSNNNEAGDDGGGKNMYAVSSVELIGPSSTTNGSNIHRLFVAYRRRCVSTPPTATSSAPSNDSSKAPLSSSTNTTTPTLPSGPTGGVCCYDLGGLRIPGQPLPSLSTSTGSLSTNAPVVSARYDMDGRDVGTSCLCDDISLPHAPPTWVSSKSSGDDGKNNSSSSKSNNDAGSVDKMLPRYAVARSDGLHLYSPEEKVGVCPIDGHKVAICTLPPPPVVYLRRPIRRSGLDSGSNEAEQGKNGATNAGASYALVATTDSKSNRDAVDIYDTSNKLVGYHVLLSPGHRALRTVGIYSSPTVGSGSLIRGGRSSAVVLTSGGSIVTLTEKVTPDKVELLTQKNLYGAAISLAFSDPQFYCPEDIVSLYRQYAEHLYRKGDFAAAMDKYILTIGSLESSHVIFRYLDAPKISLAVKYLEALRVAGLASSVHDELLRTCYLKLGDVDAASKIILTKRDDGAPIFNPDGSEVPTVPISRNLLASSDDPSEMLATICSLNAPEAVEALVAHGVLIARSLPRETAGVVIALCDGSYSPTAMADAAGGKGM